MKVSIFGREPAFYVGLVEAVLALFLSFNFLGTTVERSAVIVAVVTALGGFYTAYVTKQSLLGVGTGLTKSAVALFAAYGLAFSENQTAAIIAAAVFGLGYIQRTQTTPAPVGDPDRGLKFST